MSDNAAKQEISSHDLKQAAVSGVRWTTAARAASEVVSLVSAIVLARLIAPAQFGEAVVPLIFVPLAVIFTFEGVGSALVQRKEIEPRPRRGGDAGEPRSPAPCSARRPSSSPTRSADRSSARTSAELLQVISPVFLLAGLGAVSRGLLWRRLDFRRVSVIEMVSLALGAVVRGGDGDRRARRRGDRARRPDRDRWSPRSSCCWSSVPPSLPRWHRAALRDVVGFGLPASAAGPHLRRGHQRDHPVRRRDRLSTAQVGLYWRAFQLGVVYQDKISGIMMRLAFPIYSRTSDLARAAAASTSGRPGSTPPSCCRCSRC